MSQHHLITHAYDSQNGWVRVQRTPMTPAHAADFRDRGFTMVRSRRGIWGSRELPISWYVGRRSSEDSARVDASENSVASVDQSEKLRQRLDETTGVAPSGDEGIVPAASTRTSASEPSRALEELLRRVSAAA